MNSVFVCNRSSGDSTSCSDLCQGGNRLLSAKPQSRTAHTGLCTAEMASLHICICTMYAGLEDQTLTEMLSDVCRYLNEESLEIQVWGGVVTGRRKSGAEGRPRAEDTLLGLAYVPLGELLGHWDESGPQIR